MSYVLRTASILIVTAVVVSAEAQEAKSTKIHVHFDMYSERLTPTPWSGTSAYEVSLILTGKNNIHEISDKSAGAYAIHAEGQQLLGKGYWHVVNMHTIERIHRRSRNTDFIVIHVDGTKCSAKWRTELLPGFNTYDFTNLSTSKPEIFAKVRMVASTCAIE